MAVFSIVAPCGLVEIYRFRGSYLLRPLSGRPGDGGSKDMETR